jgi:hypothetical protein
LSAQKTHVFERPIHTPVKEDAAKTTASDPTRSIQGAQFSALRINDFGNALHKY